MRRRDPVLLDDAFDDDDAPPDLAVPIDLTRDDLDDEDDLGFRALYEDPEPLLRARRPARAA